MPASFVQPISFTTPSNYGADLDAIQRRMALAQSLQGQSLEPVQGNGAPVSWTQGLAKIAQAYAARRQEQKGQEQMNALAGRYQSDYANTVRQGLTQLQGAPGHEDAAGNWTAAQAPDPAAAMATFGGHPQAASMVPLAMEEMRRQRLIEALRGPQAGGGAPAPAAPAAQQPQPPVQYQNGQFMSQPSPAGPVSGPLPTAAPQQANVGGPAGGLPMAAWLQVDPSGKAYMQQLAKDQAESQKFLVNRGFGGGRMVNGQYVRDPASEAQALEFERQKAAIAAQYAPPHNVPTESGQNVTVFPAEQPGIIAARQGAQAPAQAPATGAPFAERPLHPVSRMLLNLNPGLGRFGVTEPEEAKVQRATRQAAGVEASKEFISEMRQNYSKLRDAPAMLSNIEAAKGLIPQARGFMGPQGESMLTAAKFLNNRLGMEIDVEGVTKAEELRTRIFQQVMDNLKKMDAQPSTYQQKVMEDALGKLGTDPNALPRVLDVMGDLVAKRVDIHNQTVDSALRSGTAFPHDVHINLPKKGGKQPTPQEIVDELKRRGAVK